MIDFIKAELEKIMDNINSAHTGIMTRSLLSHNEIHYITFSQLTQIAISVLIKELRKYSY